MKICFAGLGSIGQRHLHNLARILGEREISLEVHALRNGSRSLPRDVEALLTRQESTFSGLDGDYDVFFVTNPTIFHAETIREAVNISANLFIEKPIFSSSQIALNSIPWKTGGIYHVACPLRFSPVFLHLKKNLPRKIHSVRALCSSYLPDWRPGQDYSRTYSASREMGGGVRLDLIHEMDYIVSLFGFPRRLVSMGGKYSDLRGDSEDLAAYIAEYDEFLVEIHLDYFGRVPRREIEMCTDEDVTIYDFINKKCRYLRTSETTDLSEGRDMYLSEMVYFLDHVLSGTETINGYSHAYRLLKLAEG